MKKTEEINLQETISFGERPKMAICYDFDRTLSPDDMQTFTLIPSFGIDAGSFWHESDELATEHLMDKNLAWMYELIKYSKFKGRSIRREYFKEIGKDVQLYEGVTEWFENINAYAEKFGIEVEHYIISSGLKEIIEGSEIAKYFKRIYASSYMYSADGIAEWPAQVVNYTTKTQFIFRIAKGILEEYDERINDNMPKSKYSVPYKNIVYIGDSATDIPCMQLVKDRGGYSIGVYDPKSKNKKKVLGLFNDDRLNFFAPAKYTENSQIFGYMKRVIEEIGAREKQRAEQAKLREQSEEYRKSETIKKVLKENNLSLTGDEKVLLEHMIDKLENY
jgi:2-hydroxy-3-keto-5-methylthiopentenyl-1-phosphate phosphatase